MRLEVRLIYRSVVLLLATITVALLTFGGVAVAGDYHKGSGLHCTDCHIMHASKDVTTYNSGTGFSTLLKAASANALCMQCHDGADTTAPDLVASGTAASPNDTLGISYTSKYKNSAGYFQSDYSSAQSGKAHDLYATGALTATQGTWASGASGIDCADCHDPHGTANYRNLVLQPGTGGADISIASGTEVFLKEAITVPATASDTATHYDTSAVGFDDVNHIVNWCVDCHTNITTGNKHPQNSAISGAGEGAHWTSGTTGTPGFGTDVGDGSSGIPRVRFAQSGGSYAATTTAADTNQVFCLSCHKAHGSKYDSTVVWPYYEGGADQTSACDQCHNKGA